MSENTSNRAKAQPADRSISTEPMLSSDHKIQLNRNLAEFAQDYFGGNWRVIAENFDSTNTAGPAIKYCGTSLFRNGDPIGEAVSDFDGLMVLFESQFGVSIVNSGHTYTNLEHAVFVDFVTGIIDIFNNTVCDEVIVADNDRSDQTDNLESPVGGIQLTLERDGASRNFCLLMTPRRNGESSQANNDLDNTVLSARCLVPVSTRSLAFLRDIRPGDRLECTGDPFISIRGRIVAKGSLHEAAGMRALQISPGNQSEKRVA